MSMTTNLQWCDSTVNLIMGCLGCELLRRADYVLRQIDRELSRDNPQWRLGDAEAILEKLIQREIRNLIDGGEVPLELYELGVTQTNLYHLRFQLAAEVANSTDRGAEVIVLDTIREHLKCYAWELHANKSLDITKPWRTGHPGYAESFTRPKRFPGRMAKMAKAKLPTEKERSGKEWLRGLPRVIFVSDMGDAFSLRSDFDFIAEEIGDSILTESGQRHMWLWLTKRPAMMASFTEQYFEFPANACAMTTVTSRKTLSRVQELRNVRASLRGLSIEPLWEDVSEQIDLSGIDWMIVGGESAKSKSMAAPFELEWARSLRDKCDAAGVAFFMKQLGSNPLNCGASVDVSHSHGGNWNEWPEDLRIREFPDAFRWPLSSQRDLSLATATTALA